MHTEAHGHARQRTHACTRTRARTHAHTQAHDIRPEVQVRDGKVDDSVDFSARVSMFVESLEVQDKHWRETKDLDALAGILVCLALGAVVGVLPLQSLFGHEVSEAVVQRAMRGR